MSTIISDFDHRGSRRISVTIFLIVMLLFLVAFNFIPVPNQEFADRTVEELLLERIVLESITVPEDNDPEETIETEEKIELAPAQDVTSEDFVQLMEVFGDFSYSQVDATGSNLKDGERRDLVAIGQKDLDLESDDVAAAFGGQPLDLTSDLVKRDNGLGQTTREIHSSLLSERGVSDEDRFGSQRRIVGGFEEGSGSGLDLRETDRGGSNLLRSTRDEGGFSFDDLEIDLEMPVEELINWFEGNQSPLDPGVRALFQYRPGNLTAKTQITTDSLSYGLQLMHAPGGGETHIAVIDRKILFYFIDPGLQQRISRFEKGFVRFDEDLRVVIVESEDLSARSEEALRAFKLFIDWWVEQQPKQ